MIQQLRPIFANYITSIDIDRCVFNKSGIYNGLFPNNDTQPNDTAPIRILNSAQITMTNKDISGFGQNGLINFEGCSNIIFINNTITVDIEHLFYNVTKSYLVFDEGYNPLYIQLNIMHSELIQNVFQTNPLSSTAWIGYYNNVGINCLSANSFVNYSIHAQHTNITSCLRPNIIRCVADNKCTDTLLGPIDDSLVYDIGYFNVSHLTPMIINFSAISESYYPGQSLTFGYIITDRLYFQQNVYNVMKQNGIICYFQQYYHSYCPLS